MQIRYSLSGGVSTFSPHLGEIAIKFSLRLFRQIKTFLLRHFMQKPRISKSNFSKIHNKYFYQFQVLCADPIISLRKIHIRSIIQILLHQTQTSVSPILTSKFDFFYICLQIFLLCMNFCPNTRWFSDRNRNTNKQAYCI